MTDQPTIEAPPVQVTPRRNTKLEQLHSMYAEAKAKADAAAAELKTVTDGLKAELAKAAPGQQRVTLASAYGPTLALTYVESWRVDSTRLKSEAPEIYVRFAKKSGAWQLRPAQGGGR